MTKSEDRRTAMVERLAAFVLTHGLAASNLRALAQAAGVSDRMLLYYFTDKADIMTATLGHIAAQLADRLSARTASLPLAYANLKAAVIATLADEDMAQFMTLWLEIASLSARGDPLYRHIGEHLGRGFLAWGAVQLDCAAEPQRVREAAQLLIEIEGMALLRSLGMADVCALAL